MSSDIKSKSFSVICDSSISDRFARASTERAIDVLKMAYLKHVVGDDSIGWDELSSELECALSDLLPVGGFSEWLEEINSNE